MRPTTTSRTRGMRRGLARLAPLLLLALAASCDGEPTGDTAPEPGELVIALRSPHADDAAIHFTLSGDGIEDVLAADASDALFVQRSATGTIDVVVAADALGGAVARVAVPNVHAASRYRATIVSVADTRNRVRATLDGYALEVAAADR